MAHFLATATLAAATLFGTPNPIDAVFNHTGDDSLGGAFAFALKQRMEESSLYRFVSGAKNSMRPARVEVELVSMNVGSPRTGLASSISLIAVVQCGSFKKIAHHSLLLIGPDSLDGMVKRSLAAMDDHIVEEMNLGCQKSDSDNPVTLVSAKSSVDPNESRMEIRERPVRLALQLWLSRPAAAVDVADSVP